MCKAVYVGLFSLVFSQCIMAENSLKIAFMDGLKAAIDVVKYENSQKDSHIPRGYCASIGVKLLVLSEYEKVKLESLALFLKLNPSMFTVTSPNRKPEDILCLDVSVDKQKIFLSIDILKESYPNIEKYTLMLKALPEKDIFRIIPGVKYQKRIKKSIHLPSIVKKDTVDVSPIIKKKKIILFESHSVKITASDIPKVSFIEHIKVKL